MQTLQELGSQLFSENRDKKRRLAQEIKASVPGGDKALVPRLQHPEKASEEGVRNLTDAIDR